MRSWNVIALSILAGLALVFSYLPSVNADDGNSAPTLPVSYFVLIDAGSTGSRAHVHEYRVHPAKPLPLVEESKSIKIKPGMSHTYIRTLVTILLNATLSQFPFRQWPLLATVCVKFRSCD
jgi:hypothetical protein